MSHEQQCEVPLTHRISNASSLHKFPTRDDGTLDRDMLLDIWVDKNDNFMMSPLSEKEGDFSAQKGSWRTKLALSKADLFSAVDECRRRWRDCLVDFEMKSPKRGGGTVAKKVFQEEWDLAKFPEFDVDQVGRQLALAGHQLFVQVFRNPRGPGLTRLGRRLAELSQERPLAINVQTSDFFLPWGLLYVHPDPKEKLDIVEGSNFSWDGFWGRRHIIEQNPEEVDFDWALRPNGDKKLLASVNIDNRIDAQMRTDWIESQRNFFSQHKRLVTTERSTKKELQVALVDESFADQILYFYCHGKVTGSDAIDMFRRGAIVLGDDKRIIDQEISFWRNELGRFQSTPLVFINACEQGQMQSLFFDGIGMAFLRLNAAGVIGPQIEIPGVFADEYAKRLFRKFLKPPKNGAEPPRLGRLMNQLTVEFLNQGNPLGLVYSLYRGMDCYVAPPDRAKRKGKKKAR